MWQRRKNLWMLLSLLGVFMLSSCNNGSKKSESPKTYGTEADSGSTQNPKKTSDEDEDHHHDHTCPAGKHWDDALHDCVDDTLPPCPAGEQRNPQTKQCEPITQRTCPLGSKLDLATNSCVSLLSNVKLKVEALPGPTFKKLALMELIKDLAFHDGTTSAELILNGTGKNGIRQKLMKRDLDLTTNSLQTRKHRLFAKDFQTKLSNGTFDSMKTDCPDDSATPNFDVCLALASVELDLIDAVK